ncbi:MAG TPA: SDR family NAD(P)-dependent oxidoreductase [Pirellulales bacterium]|nr:SDR family NAD(P)-dependent oxidoreductase [Pirellulales bacterium]
MLARSQPRWQSHGRSLLLGAAGLAALVVARRLLKPRLFDLRGKHVLIVGGTRGLGLLLAREAARLGARVAISGRDATTLERARDDLLARGATVLTVQGDVTDPEQARRMVRTVQEQWGRIDVLINNAGVIQAGPMEVMTVDDYRQALETHFWGPLHTILEVLPAMRRRGEGRIVNIASIGGKISVPHLLPYSASKFALVGLSEGLRAELAKDGVKVTTVCPGLMRTGSPRNADFKGKHRAEYAWFSISDALPGASMSAERAARQIIAACRRGDAEIILSLPANMAAKVHGVAPGLVSRVLGWTNRLLPRAGGIGSRSAKGRDSQSAWSPSLLTVLNERAARRNNEL